MDGFECIENYFKSYPKIYWEPVEWSEKGGLVMILAAEGFFLLIEVYRGICGGHRRGVSCSNQFGR